MMSWIINISHRIACQGRPTQQRHESRVRPECSGRYIDGIHEEYDNHQGMGLINLIKSLLLKGKNSLNGALVNNQSVRDLETEYVVVKTMDCSSPHDDHPLSVTLSWYDPPGASNCAHGGQLHDAVDATNREGQIMLGACK